MFVNCCHCRDCQKQTGGAFVINALIETELMEVSNGQLQRSEMPTDSGRPHGIYRCDKCGTAIWSEYGGFSTLRFVRVSTLDEPAALVPDAHVYTRSKLPWVCLPEGVPAFDAYYDLNEVWPNASLERRRALIARAKAT